MTACSVGIPSTLKNQSDCKNFVLDCLKYICFMKCSLCNVVSLARALGVYGSDIRLD